MQTANRTKELAANTLEELERQGDKLEAIDQDLHAVSTHVVCLQALVQVQAYMPCFFAIPLNMVQLTSSREIQRNRG